MRILFVIDRGILGGIQRHVQCLSDRLRSEHKVAICIVGEVGPLGRQLEEAGFHVFELKGRNGHDLAILPRLEKVIRVFRPEVIHAHVLPILGLLWLNAFHRKIPLILSHHTSDSHPPAWERSWWMHLLCRRINYHLSVSQSTWASYQTFFPEARGEIFYNPIVVQGQGPVARREQGTKRLGIVGMVGRNCPDKGWPEFCHVAAIVKNADFWAVGVSVGDARRELGEPSNQVEWKGPQPNGRDWIRRLDVFVLTSRNEEMPTVVLECFAERTAICGFIPKGGLPEILQYSKGPLREVFIQDRDCEKLARIVERLLSDTTFCEMVVEDGWQIVNAHFDADRNCRGKLVDIYNDIVTGVRR